MPRVTWSSSGYNDILGLTRHLVSTSFSSIEFQFWDLSFPSGTREYAMWHHFQIQGRSWLVWANQWLAFSWQLLLTQWGVYDLGCPSQTEGEDLCPLLGREYSFSLLHVASITTESKLFITRDQYDISIQTQLEYSWTSNDVYFSLYHTIANTSRLGYSAGI